MKIEERWYLPVLSKIPNALESKILARGSLLECICVHRNEGISYN